MLENYNKILSKVIKITQNAGNMILDFYDKNYQIKQKSDNTPITDADLAAHQFIVAELTILTPNIPILSEEDCDIDFEIRRKWQTYWLIDPLDGTQEFINKTDEFSVNIALIHQNNSVLGVIYAPCKDLLYYASVNNGAWKSRGAEPAHQIQTRHKSEKLISIIGSYSKNQTLDDFLSQFPDNDLLTMGSSLKSCLVAEGSVDIYPRFGPTSEWDTAAAQCIIEEAGGMLVDLSINPLIYNAKHSLLNPHFLAVGDKDFNWLKVI